MKPLVGLLVLALSACAQRAPVEAAADSTAVMRALEQYREAWIAGDTGAALRYVADDIRILISGVPEINGKAAVRDMFASEMATYRVPSLTLEHQDVIVSGNHVIDIGIWEEMQVPKTGAPIHGRGRFMTVWRRDSAGDWRIVRYVLSDLPQEAKR
ncbi:MAG TPA: nuclear transport factor 2 family protein [Gemmatimonadales bacterium]|nr:nuclear transport factor 2 family protein [Gemmatimonadales bacterium]